MHVIGYIRVSTDQQAESKLGLEAQTQSINEYAKKIGLNIQEIFNDPGFSGALSIEKRPALLNALSMLKKGSILIVAKRDRLGRDPLVIAMIESAVQRKGARIVSTAGEGTESNDPSSIFMRRLIDAFGEYERLIIGARTKDALAVKKRRNERVGHIPYGYRLAQDTIRLIEDEKEQSNIAYMLQLIERNCPIRTIAEIMNRRQTLNRDNMPWTHSSVFRVTKNRG